MPDDDRVATTLAEWGKLTRAATIGPWEKLGLDDIWSQPAGRHVAETMNREADAEFIVTARTAMPRLLAAVDAALKAADDWSQLSALRAQDECASELRAAITAELTKGAGDGTSSA